MRRQSFISRLIPIITISVLVVVIAILVILIHKPAKEELVIDDTSNIVTEIRKISEFTSACYYKDVILKEKKANERISGKVVNSFSKKDDPILEDLLVIIASGNVRAGFDLSKIDSSDIVVTDSCLQITLPKAEILEAVVNPSGFDIFIEEGKWSHQQVTKVEDRAILQLKKDAINDGLLDKANELGVARLTELFKTFGYNQVIIKTRS